MTDGQRNKRLLAWALVTTVLVGAGGAILWKLKMVPGGKRTLPSAGDLSSTDETPEVSASKPAEGGPAPSLAELAPAFSLVGEDGVVPAGLRVAFARPLSAEGRGEVPSGTALTFDPPVDGALRWDGPSALIFTPAKPFAFETAYKATLTAVDVQGVLADFSATGGASHAFTTPAFDLKRVNLARIGGDGRDFEVNVVFTGPVDPARVGAKSAFAAGGKPLKATWRQGPDANTALATVKMPSGAAVTELAYTLAAGLQAAAHGATIGQAVNRGVRLFEGDDIEVKLVKLKEGTNGFYIQVICNDTSRTKGAKNQYDNRIYWYDNESQDGMYVTDRCQLQESAAQAAIRFEPAAKFSVVPSRGGFRIIGDFATGDLTLTIDAGVPSVDGGVLKVPVHEKFMVPHRQPQVTFAAQGRYLPRDSWKSLALRHLNVEEAELKVRVIPLENLVFWLSSDMETADERNSHLLLEKTVKLGGAADKTHTTTLDLTADLPAPPRGVVEFSVTGRPAGKSVDRKRLVVTDLNLVVKAGRENAVTRVWALGMHTAAPVAGVTLKLITKSGRVISDCKTAADGGCSLAWNKDAQADKSPPFAVIAQNGDDLTYVRFEDLKVQVSEQLVQGRPFSGGASPYRAAVFSDRGAYRPGETAHVSAIVRGGDDVAPKEGMPVDLVLTDPREKVVRKLTIPTSAAGFVAADFSFPHFANTGRYRVTATAATAEIGRYEFNVEEFVPERLKVEVTAETKDLKADARAAVTIAARYLFGGSAEGSRVELSCRVEPSVFAPKENANFHYGVWYPDQKAPKPVAMEAVSGVLDAEGRTTLECPTPEGSLFAGPARIVAKAAVFEGESGRSTQADTEIPLHPDEIYIGLSSGQDKVKAGDTLTYEGILVDWQGKVVEQDGLVEIEFVRLETEYDWGWNDDGGGSGYNVYLRQASEGRSEVQVAKGRFKGEFKTTGGGAAYLVRAKRGQARTDLSVKGEEQGWWWWYPGESGRDQTPKPFKPAWLDVKGPDSLKAGGKAVFTVTAPFKGRMLLTAETDEVIAAEWRDVAAGPVEWTLELAKFHPNVYVSAFIVKDPHLESPQGFMPDRAFGVRSFRVDATQFSHNLTLKVPEEIKPNSTLKVDLDLGGPVDGPAFVVVAAVDEGILQLTRFKSPDPNRTLFEPRALGISTFETVGWNVMLAGAGPASPTGGDGEGDGEPISLVKPVALWSGVREVGKDGKVSVSLEVPQYRGELRVMAVSFDPRRAGAAAAAVPVRDPLVLQTTLPRFLTEGDEIMIPVSITNMTGADQKVDVELSTSGIDMGGAAGEAPGQTVKIIGNAKTTVPLAVGKSQTVVFRATTAVPVGGAAFKVRASAGAFESFEDLEVPILSAKPRTRVLKRLEVKGDSLDLLSELDGFVPTTEKTSVWVTANPYADALGHLKALVQYPYGCIEQTTSSTRPLLVIRDLIDEIDPGVLKPGDTIDDMVKKGIDRVLSMQTRLGGFGYWPGDDSPTLWGTAYASHMLLDAQKLGFPVPKERLDEAIEYLHGQITNRYRHVADSDDADYYDLRHSAPYMHYVLARAGRGLKADMDQTLERLMRAKDKKDGEIQEQIYMLKAALWLAGDRRFEGDLKKPDISALTNERRNSWSFWSDLRRRGFMLSTFADLFGAAPEGEALASLVAGGLRTHTSRWYTTQELLWGITGLGKFVVGGAKNFKAELMVNGKARKPVKEGVTSWLVPRASEKKSLTVDVERKGEGKLYAVVSSEGVREGEGYKTGGEGLAVERRFLKSDGSALDVAADVKLGQVIFVELKIDNRTTERVENIALVDRFPAGWEVENPRLGRGATAEFIDPEAAWQVAYMNIRDDRLELFGALKPGEDRRVWYALRATVSGSFTIPPVEAEAMYDPNIWARAPGGRANVKGPWEEFAGP